MSKETTPEQKQTAPGYPLSIEELKRAIALSEKYFNVGLGYLDFELNQVVDWEKVSKDAEYPQLAALETIEEVLIYSTVSPTDFTKIFSSVEEDDECDSDIVKALFIVASQIRDKGYNEICNFLYEEVSEELLYDGSVRKDLLNLYIFSHTEHETGIVTIKQGKGAEHKTDLEYASLWFYPRMVNEYLQKYLPDITSVEQAQAELATRYTGTKKGRSCTDERINIIIYGLYKMFNGEKKMKSRLSDGFCDMAIAYLEQLQLIEHGDVYVTRQWIRSQVAYMEQKEKAGKPIPQFIRIELSRHASLEDLNGRGFRLY